MSKIKSLLHLPVSGVKSSKEVLKGFKQQRYYNKATCVLVNQNRARIVDGIISNDLKYVIPKGYHLRFLIEHALTMEDGGGLLFFLNVKNPQSFHPDYEPKTETVEYEVIKETFENGELVKTYDVSSMELKGAEILNKVGFDLMNTSILKFLEEPSQKQIIMIFLLGGMVFFIPAYIAAMISFMLLF